MRTTLLKFFPAVFVLVMLLGFSSIVTELKAQSSTDTTKTVRDNSSSFNDSVQFDDMEPIFYEATKDEPAAVKSSEKSGTGVYLYLGIAVVLLVMLVVLKKAGKKKA